MRTDLPKTVDGLTAVARLIASHFGIQCSKQYITNWLRVSPEYPVPFPRADVNSNRFNVEEVFKWVETYYLPKMEPKSEELFKLAAEAEAKKKIRENKEHEFEFDVLQGKYIKRDVARRTAIGVAKKMWSMVRQESERHSPAWRRDTLRGLGATPELVAAFYEKDLEQARKVTEMLETKFNEAGKE